MRYLKYFALLGILVAVAAVHAPAQVALGVGFGPGYVAGSPVCTYGYYDYYPYACAPYGFYGPSYFVGGVFIGAGPWYHGYDGPRYYGHSYYGYGRSYYGHGYGWGHGYRGGYGGGYYGHGFHGGGGYYGGGGFHGGHGGRR
ncbi:MAG: hypothetical protein DMG97_05475 [Acidobacteria bacterium]|nr:MAG: hypothetical protein DMG98_26595 [Acidobacteriota bacterium]PYV74796.1 MAG: hypothetical protein DMG96_19370 [Acidobacteriota bacterium]PYV75877.1 MAG: hypothetical protein DMG97_05475 [Acidobacteriota bacterium]